MTRYYEDWTSALHVVGAQPNGWTKRWATSGTPWKITANASEDGTRNACVFSGGAGVRNLLSWDAIDSDPNRANLDILLRAKSSNANTNGDIRVAGRATGGSGTEDGYTLGFANATMRMIEYNAGTAGTTLSNPKTGRVANQWYWIRAQINGTTLQTRMFDDLGTEPGTWDWSGTDSTITSVGWVGLLQTIVSGDTTIDRIGVGTGADSAPSSPLPVQITMIPGSFRFAGVSPSLSMGTILYGDGPGSVQIAGLPTQGQIQRIQTLDPAALSLAGMPSQINRGLIENMDPGQLRLAGLPANLLIRDDSTVFYWNGTDEIPLSTSLWTGSEEIPISAWEIAP